MIPLALTRRAFLATVAAICAVPPTVAGLVKRPVLVPCARCGDPDPQVLVADGGWTVPMVWVCQPCYRAELQRRYNSLNSQLIEVVTHANPTLFNPARPPGFYKR